MKKSGTPTKYPGVFKLGTKSYRVRGKYTDPRTGKTKEVDRILGDVTLRQASRRRTELLEQARTRVEPDGERVRIGEYARSWIASKALKIDPNTARMYADSLELHILPTFGEFFYDALTSRDVQAWVDAGLVDEFVTPSGKRKRYARNSVHGWFCVLRTMTRDAMQALDLERDPTMRISFPPRQTRMESNALSPEELARFLDAMRALYPQHYAITVMLAYTGLRFCHVSAFRWEDWDEEADVLRVVRKHAKGKLGPVSRKKQAPRMIPICSELATVLREHRARLERERAPGFADGWMFPTSTGTLRQPSGLHTAFKRCCERAGITRRFTVHGLRYTFTDLVRRASVDTVVRRALIGHVTEQMQHHYSTVGLDEKRAAVDRVSELAPLRASEPTPDSRPPAESGAAESTDEGSSGGGDRGGDSTTDERSEPTT